MILVNAAADVKTRFTSQIELYSSIGKHTNVLQFFGVCTVAGKMAMWKGFMDQMWLTYYGRIFCRINGKSMPKYLPSSARRRSAELVHILKICP